jgi:hypothetical protein
VRVNKTAVILIFAFILTTGCSSGGTYSGNSSEQHPCEVLKSNYFSEYQAYVDARAANNGVEDAAVMSHYYASGEYAIQFSEADCENQGFSLDASDSNSTSGSESSGDEYLESEITEVILNRLNQNSNLSWSVDPFNDITGSNALGVVLSDDGECGVWIFNNVMDILKAFDRGLFVNTQSWYGPDERTNFGILLISNSPDNECASDLVETVNWNGLE